MHHTSNFAFKRDAEFLRLGSDYGRTYGYPDRRLTVSRHTLLQLLSYGTVLAFERQTWCRTAPACREPIKHCMVQLVTQYTAVTRQTPAAKSHPSGSNPLHLVPLERLRNLVATHPAAVGVQWSNHVWDPFLPVFLVNRQASLRQAACPC